MQSPQTTDAHVPDTLLPRVHASLAADNPAYAISAVPDDVTTLRAVNPAHGLITAFTQDGPTFTSGSETRWALRLAAIGDNAVPVLSPTLVGNRAEYHRDTLVEWYLNGPLGVEQGFTLAAPPASGDALALILTVSAGVVPRLDNDAVILAAPSGDMWVYGHLLVTDATGRQLPAYLAVTESNIAIHADLAGAVYPVTVDPLVATKKLKSNEGVSGDEFGFSVAMNNDGTKVIVGAPGKEAAYVYSGNNYAIQQKLTASDSVANDRFGTTVAMSSDGTQVIIGAYQKTIGPNNRQGAVYIYSGTNYATEKRLIASDGAGSDFFGYAAGMSGDGTKVIVGAYGKNIGNNLIQGAAYIYSGTDYATEKRLIAGDGGALDYFGSSVAMSTDGTRVLIGSPFKALTQSIYPGAAYVYSGGSYVIEQKLIPSDGTDGDRFGNAVELSGDGTKVIVGAYYKKISTNTYQGAAYVYSGGSYSNEKRLTASDGVSDNEFGSAVAISSDGTTATVTTPYAKIGTQTNQGAAYVYSGVNYAGEQKLTASDGVSNAQFGSAVTISATGTTVIVGAHYAYLGGAAYVFASGNGYTPTPNPLPPTKLPGTPRGSANPAPAPKPSIGPSGTPNPQPQRHL